MSLRGAQVVDVEMTGGERARVTLTMPVAVARRLAATLYEDLAIVADTDRIGFILPRQDSGK